ncbi:RNA polymerase sigma factor FliA [Cellvibrio sp. KY-GH-1]|uniref:RNA polymerase sigma factor FliA n=1 Tax=Cellvibrio sp. KY-GH-1 TaxID=2303332 RepID=UPI00177BDBD2
MYDKKTLLDAQINIEDYAPLVKRIAYHMMMRMPASVQVDDLIQAGMIGLIEASQKYDMSRGASFETYAGIRIRGAIVDEMRRGDWVPRSVHRNARRVSQAIAAVEARTGRDATDGEVAAELGVSLDEYFVMLQDSSSARLFSYEETFGEEDSNIDASEHSSAFVSPLEGMQRDGLKKALFDAICQLPEREQMVLSLYYDQELNLKEIGLVLGVSESRVSQIHSQAAARLRTKLSDWHTG